LSLHMPIVALYFHFGNWKYDPGAEYAAGTGTKIYGLNHRKHPLENSQSFALKT
jgi:hypothetical protein